MILVTNESGDLSAAPLKANEQRDMLRTFYENGELVGKASVAQAREHAAMMADVLAVAA